MLTTAHTFNNKMSRIQQLFIVAAVMMKSWTMAKALSDGSGLQEFTSTEGLNRRLRGVKAAPIRVSSRRLMGPMKGSSSSSFPSYLGCLNMTASDLEANWIFPGTAPSCSYVHHNGSSGSNSGSSSGSSGTSGGSSSSGGSGSNSGSSGSNGGSSSGDGSGSSSGNESDNSSSSNNGDGSSSSGNSGSGNNNSGGDSSSSGNSGGDSSSGNNGSGDTSTDNSGGDSSSSGNNGSSDTSSNNNGYDGNDDEGRNSGNQDGNGDNGGSNGGYDGSSSTVTNGEYVYGDGYDGYSGQGDGYSGNGYSGDGNYSPYSDFDVGTCDTYENLWLWDFSLTCDDADNLESCECNFAEEMMGIGLLSCDMAAQCPKDCAICTTCFQVIGCVTGGTEGLNGAKSAANFLYVIAAGVGVLFFGIIYYSANRKRRNQDLGAYLMEDEGTSGSGAAASTSPLAPPVWQEAPAPDNASTADMTTPKFPSSPVWLAPDASPAQFVPSSEAAMESSGESSHETDQGAFIIPCILPACSNESSESEDNNVWLAPVV